MPVYAFIAPAGAATLAHSAEISRAVTRVHSELTGAPARYVQCSFVEAPADRCSSTAMRRARPG
jgi:hypothetical protein